MPPVVRSELAKLEHARSDIESASAAWALLAAWSKLEELAGEHAELARVDWDAAWLAVWTGAVVSYVRPFTKSSYRVGGRWEAFDDPSLKAAHDSLKRMRRQLFAHTDETPLRELVRSARPTTFGSLLHIGRLRKLCRFQLDRLEKQIAELEAAAVSAGR